MESPAVSAGPPMRVNDRSYLAAYETRGGSMWRLETVGRGAHHGLVAEGTSDTLSTAKESVRDALRDRFPDVARAVDMSVGGGVASPAFGWVSLPGGRDERTEHRVFDERVVAMVAPGPGGQWQTWVTADGSNRQGPHSRDAAAAKDVADGLAHGALLELAAVGPDRANAMVRDLASGEGTWNRDRLVSIVGHRLTDADRASLAETNDMRTLTRHLLDVGVLAPATILGVLHAEVASIDAVTAVVPSLGMPTSDAIRVLHRDWVLTERMPVHRWVRQSESCVRPDAQPSRCSLPRHARNFADSMLASRPGLRWHQR